MTGWNVVVTPVIRPYDRCQEALVATMGGIVSGYSGQTLYLPKMYCVTRWLGLKDCSYRLVQPII